MDNRQPKGICKFMITLIVGGDGHDRSGAIAGENIIGNPDGDLLPVDRIQCIGSGKDAGLFLGEISAFQVALAGAGLLVGSDSLLLWG